MKPALITLMSDFTYNKVGDDGIISISFYKDTSDIPEKYDFRAVNVQKDESFDAFLYKPGVLKPPYEHEAKFLISKSGILKPTYHVLYIHNFENRQPLVAYDICNNHDASFIWEWHTQGILKHLPLKRIPPLLLK